MPSPKDRQNSAISMAEAEMMEVITSFKTEHISDLYHNHYAKKHITGVVGDTGDRHLSCRTCKVFW